MSKRTYRFITGPDDANFCRRITEALNAGFELYGQPQLTVVPGSHTTAAHGYCGQAVVKVEPDDSL